MNENPNTSVVDALIEKEQLELYDLCRKVAGKAVWALGQGYDDFGKPNWVVYCSKKKMLSKLPTEFNGAEVLSLFLVQPKTRKG